MSKRKHAPPRPHQQPVKVPEPVRAAEPVKKPPVVKPSRLSSFLRKHDRVLSFTGAGIIFVTFVAKEGLKDHMKELVDSIGSAQNIFVVRGDSSMFTNRLRKLQRQTDAIEAKLNAKAPDRDAVYDSEDSVFSRTERLAQDQRELGANVDNVERLLKKTSQGGPSGQTLERLKTGEENLHKDMEELGSLIEKERDAEENKADDKLAQSLLAKIDDAIQNVENKQTRLSIEIRTLAATVLKSAEAESERREASYSFWTWTSYVLYSVGWGLGLLGKIGGVPAASGGE